MTLRNICAFVLALVVVLEGRLATADERRVAVVPFQGEAGARAESEVYEALNAQFFLIAPNKIAKGIRDIGGLRESARGSYAAFAKKVHADAIVSGSLVRDTKWRLRVAVRDGRTGTLVASTGWTGQRLKDVSLTITGAASSWLVAQLAKTGKTGKTGPAETLAAAPAPSPRPAPRRAPAAAAPDEETDDSEEASDVDPEPSPRPASSRRSAESTDDDQPATLVKRRFATRTPTFELAVGPRVFSRSFTYTDNLAGLPGYTIVGAPGAEVDLEIYPLARVDTGIRNLGFAASYETAHSARTQAPSGAATSYETKISAYRAGIRYSIPLSRLLFVLGADYGQHRFALVGGPDQSPNVGYRFVRPSATLRLDVVSALAVGLTVGYSNVTAVEGLGDANRFHRLTVVGVDARAMVGYFFSTGIELKLVGDVRYYAHSMNVQPGDPVPVGGAIDAHVGASLLLGYLLR